MITKDQVIQTVNDLPDNFSAEELIQKIILLDKIEIGLKQSETGKVVTNEEAKKRLAKWLA
jgi:predicted transcriptional regulator